MINNVLITTLFRDNEAYIPYYLKCCADMEKVCSESVFQYLFYTNNNSDNTLSLLENQKTLEKVKVVSKEFDNEHLSLERTVRLSLYRDELLDIIKTYSVDYVLFIDTDIFFNGKMVRNMILNLQDSNRNVISAYSLNYMGIYYDTYAYLDEDNNYGYGKLRIIEYWQSRLKKNRGVFPVISAYGGLYLAKKIVLNIENLSYRSDKIACEHIAFNKCLYEHGNKIYIHTKVTPLWANSEKNYEAFYQMTLKRKTDFYSEMNFFKCLFREFQLLLKV
ncbi:MAG: hypothetical protein JXR10_15200 [Cyclobacteriaceae bacterium]